MSVNGRKSNKEIWERLTKLETKMDRMISNDLVHLERKVDRNSDKIDSIERKLAMAAGALAILQILVPIIVHIFIGD